MRVNGVECSGISYLLSIGDKRVQEGEKISRWKGCMRGQGCGARKHETIELAEDKCRRQNGENIPG